ncbi:MAG: hypothetical protein PHO41_07175 [Eubacteriales bacterium]|nr:hypothetical protein [Eubacteriales bacterium]
MRVFVITKKMLLLGGGVLLLLGIILAVALLGNGEEQAAQTMSAGAETEMYELAVLVGKKKELPVYSVAREDKKIALTIDAACAEASMW